MASSARQAMLDHSRKKLEPASVMRALVEHDDWHVPLNALGRPVTDGLFVYAAQPHLAAHQLNVFTDRAACDLAASKFGAVAMGTYAGGIKGVELYSGLLTRPVLDAALILQVNPGSAIEEQWFVERASFGLCAIWAQAIVLERTIGASLPGWAEAMRRYATWLVVLGKTDNTLVRINLKEKGEHALIFSAPDLADHFLNGLPNAGAAACKTATLGGAQLFKFVKRSGAKGFIVNASSNQTRVFDASACEAILNLDSSAP